MKKNITSFVQKNDSFIVASILVAIMLTSVYVVAA